MSFLGWIDFTHDFICLTALIVKDHYRCFKKVMLTVFCTVECQVSLNLCRAANVNLSLQFVHVCAELQMSIYHCNLCMFAAAHLGFQTSICKACSAVTKFCTCNCKSLQLCVNCRWRTPPLSTLLYTSTKWPVKVALTETHIVRTCPVMSSHWSKQNYTYAQRQACYDVQYMHRIQINLQYQVFTEEEIYYLWGKKWMPTVPHSNTQTACVCGCHSLEGIKSTYW